jgi:hypothetical protein
VEAAKLLVDPHTGEQLRQAALDVVTAAGLVLVDLD